MGQRKRQSGVRITRYPACEDVLHALGQGRGIARRKEVAHGRRIDDLRDPGDVAREDRNAHGPGLQDRERGVLVPLRRQHDGRETGQNSRRLVRAEGRPDPDPSARTAREHSRCVQPVATFPPAAVEHDLPGATGPRVTPVEDLGRGEERLQALVGRELSEKAETRPRRRRIGGDGEVGLLVEGIDQLGDLVRRDAGPAEGLGQDSRGRDEGGNGARLP